MAGKGEIILNCYCPPYKKIFQGMKYLEVSENLVLEGEMYKLDNFDFK